MAVSITSGRVRAETQYKGCVAIISNFDDTVPLAPNGQQPCQDHCTSQGYPYFALSAQFCACSRNTPGVAQTYADSDCAFNCDDPYETQSCGGMDQQTFTFIYNLYFDPSLQAASSSGIVASSSTEVITSPPPSSLAASMTSNTLPSPSSNASATASTPQPLESSSGLGVGFVGSGSLTTFRARPQPEFATLTQTVYKTSTFTCSDGSLESTVIPTLTELVYDPALNTLITVTYSSTTIVTLVAASTATADIAALPTSLSASNGTDNNQTSDPVYTPVMAAARCTRVRNDQLMLWVMLLALALGL